jgi:hypothetical protein
MFSVLPYTDSQPGCWDKFVMESKNGTFLFMRDYMDYHEDRFVDCSVVVADRSGRVVALFPANKVACRLVSHGGLSYGGMVSDRSMTTSRALDVFAAWLEYCRDMGIEEIIYKTVPAIYHRAPADEDRYALFCHNAQLYRREVLSVVELAAIAPPQERRRRGARKAAKHGLEVRESNDLEEFWPILATNLAAHHYLKPVHTVAEMRLLRDRFPTNISLVGVFQGARMCAGSVLYHAGPAIHAQYIAATDDARRIGALDLLFTTLIAGARQQVRYFDFGNSNEQEGRYLNRGLADFKEGFGARAICQDFYRLALSAR